MPYRGPSENPAFAASLRLGRGKFASRLNSVRIVERKDVSKARTCGAPAASCSAKPSTTPAAATNVLEVTVPLSPPGSGPRHWFRRAEAFALQSAWNRQHEQWLTVGSTSRRYGPPHPGVFGKEAVSRCK